MIDNLDELIELNLKLLYDSPNKYMWRIDFKNEKGQKIQDSLRFAKILDKKGLIDLEQNKMYRCELTEFGNKIIINGGWLKYLENENLINKKNKSSTIITENYIAGDNYGNQLSFRESKNTSIKQQNQPISNEIKQNPIISFLSKFWWQVLIPLAIVIIGILIEQKIINIEN